MSALYQTRMSAVGARSGSDDGVLDLPLAMPKDLGGKGGATNPEQLFAAGYAACFGNAVFHIARAKVDKVRDGDIEVVGQVGLPNGQNGFALSVTLGVTISCRSRQGRGDRPGRARRLLVFECGQGERRRPICRDRAMMVPHLNHRVANMRRAQSCSAS
jgi:Ohr subfamily peroxiredoxin